MTKFTNNIKANEAKIALESIEKMKDAAFKKGIPPRFFGITIAILGGALVSLAASDLRVYQVLIILMMGSLISYQRQKSGVAFKSFSIKFICIAVATLLPLYFSLIIAAQFFSDVMGLTLSSLLAGLMLSTVVYLLSIIERRQHKNKGNRSKQ